jgi:hypothetical protein
MLQDLLQLLPRDAGSATAALAMLGAIAGGILWLAGARFSRPVMTLVAVTIGAVLGSAMPGWFHWTISPMGPAVGLALLLGVSAYALQRVWVGLALGAVLAVWASLATWLALHGSHALDWPGLDQHPTVLGWLRAAWSGVPPEPAHVIPYAAAGAMIAGLAMTILWPRFSTLLAWSLIGLSMLIGMGATVVDYTRPQWVKALPPQSGAQCLALVLLIGIGLLVQSRTAPQPAPASSKKNGKGKDHKAESDEQASR